MFLLDAEFQAVKSVEENNSVVKASYTRKRNALSAVFNYSLRSVNLKTVRSNILK